MRIEQELKLGFKDVLFRPKRSTLKSRSQVNLTRDFTFKHSGRQWSGVPVIAANMDSVGSFAMAKALAEHGVMTAVHKHYTVEDWAEFAKTADKTTLNNVMVSTGTSDADFQKLKTSWRFLMSSSSSVSTSRTATQSIWWSTYNVFVLNSQTRLFLLVTS